MTPADFTSPQLELIRLLVHAEYGEALRQLREIDDGESDGPPSKQATSARIVIEVCAQIIGRLPNPG